MIYRFAREPAPDPCQPQGVQCGPAIRPTRTSLEGQIAFRPAVRARGPTADRKGLEREVVQASVDLGMARLAPAQHGVVSRAQLASIGMSRGAIGHRLAQGRLHPVHRGIYLVGHPVPPPLARETAALLACGPAAVLSHRSAAWIWRLLPDPGEDVEVTIHGRDVRARPGIRSHRTVVL